MKTKTKKRNGKPDPAIVADLSSPQLRGSYQGALQIAFGATTFLAPTLGAFVLGHWGGGVLWPACFVVGVLAAVGHLASAPAQRRRARLNLEPNAQLAE